MSIFSENRIRWAPVHHQYWGAPDSNVDWCEANYQVTWLFAEFCNALSSLPIAALGIFGAMMLRHSFRELRFHFCFFFVVLVGLGSFLFHATMKYSMQIMDEIPMMWGSNMLNYVIIMDIFYKNPPRYLAHGLVAATCGLTIIYLALPNLYAIFFIGYAISVLCMFFACLYRFSREETPALALQCFKMSVASYGIGFVLWVIENLYCDNLPVWFKLHSLWHLMAGFGTYMYVEFTLVLRAFRFRKAARLDWSMGVPFVVVGAAHNDHL